MANDENRDHWFLGTRMRMLVDATDSDGQLTVIEQTAAQGFSPPLHVHEHETTVMYVLEGEIEVLRGDERLTLVAGQSAVLPPRVPHSFRIVSESARLLELSNPGGFERFFVDHGRPATGPGLPTPEPPDVAALVAGGIPYGVQIIGPPMEALATAAE